MRCARCGGEVPEGTKLCAHCGVPAPEPEAESTTTGTAPFWGVWIGAFSYPENAEEHMAEAALRQARQHYADAYVKYSGKYQG